MLSHFSRVWLFAILQIIDHQAPLSMGFSRQKYWSELPCPPPGDLPNPGMEHVSLMSPALAAGFFTTVHHLGSPEDSRGWGKLFVCLFVCFLTHRREYIFLSAMVLMWEFEFFQLEVGMGLRLRLHSPHQRLQISSVTLSKPRLQMLPQL